MHLQYLGYPIANDPVYRDPRAWGPSGGKGGVFDEEAPLNAVQLAARQMRHEMGEKVLVREIEKLKVKERRAEKYARMGRTPASSSNVEGAEEDTLVDTTKTTTKDSNPTSVSVFNRSGAIRTDLLLDASGETNEDARLVYKLELSAAATTAIQTLKDVRDAEDGWARWRDMKGVELARAAGTSGDPDSPFAPSPSTADHVHTPVSVPQTLFSDSSNVPDDIAAPESDDAFCSTCFLPLIKDPLPEQLFIWLHALRYQTTEFDWKSPEPAWAAEDFEAVVPVSFGVGISEQVE